jgi:hypothetical protein
VNSIVPVDRAFQTVFHFSHLLNILYHRFANLSSIILHIIFSCINRIFISGQIFDCCAICHFIEYFSISKLMTATALA